MLRHLTKIVSASLVAPATASSSISASLPVSSRLISTLSLIPSSPAVARPSPLSTPLPPSAVSQSTILLSAFANSQLAESRRWRRYPGSSARKGRPWKNRSMRMKEWWVRRKTPFYDYDSNLTAENKDFVQDVLREDYQGGAQTEDGAASAATASAATASADAASAPLLSPLKDAPWTPQPWSASAVATRRCGALALKIGVVPQWLNDGTRVLCTMFQILDCHVINYTSPEEWDRQFAYDKYARISGRMLRKLQDKRGIYGVQTVGALSCDPQRFSKEYSGLFTKAGVLPKRKLTRYFVTPNAAIKPGTELSAKHFRVGDRVVVEGRTIGHGFEGVMIRWGFKGGRSDALGSSKFHRKPGNIGHGREHANVNRGKKLPGHMGNEWRVGFNLKILRINTKYNVVYVKGTCPGPPHAVMRLFDSNHHDQLLRISPDSHPPLPTHIEGVVTSGGGGGVGGEPDANGDIFDENLFDFAKPSISYAISK